MGSGYLVATPDEETVTILDLGTFELIDLTHDEVTKLAFSQNYKFINLFHNKPVRTKYFKYTRYRRTQVLYNTDGAFFEFSIRTILNDFGTRILVSDDSCIYLQVFSEIELALYFGGYLFQFTRETFPILERMGVPATSFKSIDYLGIRDEYFRLRILYNMGSKVSIIRFNKKGDMYFGNKKIVGFGKKLRMDNIQKRIVLGGMLC